MKSFISVFLIVFALQVSAEDDKYINTYVCTKGKIHFFSATKLEDIEATSSNAICVLNTQTRKVYTKVEQTTFRFPDKLMQEHYNENYMESDKYPSAILDM